MTQTQLIFPYVTHLVIFHSPTKRDPNERENKQCIRKQDAVTFSDYSIFYERDPQCLLTCAAHAVYTVNLSQLSISHSKKVKDFPNPALNMLNLDVQNMGFLVES